MNLGHGHNLPHVTASKQLIQWDSCQSLVLLAFKDLGWDQVNLPVPLSRNLFNRLLHQQLHHLLCRLVIIQEYLHTKCLLSTH
ncbi:unnamed protein product [Trifolium pratense]|uniref:Uncharacterized protein n=1 Tax=Trifolium pratense TaxID=57577 RepID=A0ACB0M0Q2_TRIPR|nr:unnamed protein product [Trifolium pratense]